MDDRLDVLVDVMVDVLASDSGSDAVGVLTLDASRGVLVLGPLSIEALLHLGSIVVLVRTLLSRTEVVVMLLGQDFPVVYGLLGGVVVVLVDFAVDGCGGLFMLRLVDGLLLNGWRNLLLDGRVVMTVPGSKQSQHCCSSTSGLKFTYTSFFTEFLAASMLGWCDVS